MPFRVTLDGAGKGMKFETKEEAKEVIWEFYKDQMSRPEFDKFIEAHIEEA